MLWINAAPVVAPMKNIILERIAMSQQPCYAMGITHLAFVPDLTIPILGNAALPLVTTTLQNANLCMETV